MPQYTADRVALTRCPGCADRLDLAVRLVAGHRATTGQLGLRAVPAAEAALAALAAAGVRLPSADCPAPVAAALVSRLALPGAGVMFSDLGVDKIKGQSAPRAWACAPSAARTQLRKAVADYLADTLHVDQPDRQLTPPVEMPYSGLGRLVAIPYGCMLWAIRKVAVPAAEFARNAASARSSVWTKHVWDAKSLGARVRGR